MHGEAIVIHFPVCARMFSSIYNEPSGLGGIVQPYTRSLVWFHARPKHFGELIASQRLILSNLAPDLRLRKSSNRIPGHLSTTESVQFNYSHKSQTYKSGCLYIRPYGSLDFYKN
jgi:hypothetical protein